MDYLLIVSAALARLIPHPPNVTPVAAMALFGGAYLSRRHALLYPLLVMASSDLLLNVFLKVPLVLPESFFVYGSFLITGLLGLACRAHRRTGVLYGACLASSIQFYLITNFGSWLLSPLYPKDGAGLLACYTLALPFFRNTLVGDLCYFSLLVGAYHLVRLPVRHRASF
ncbi:MAG: DUF6580 family putative transport protein [Candidatus Omnitrophota bacterium]